MLDFGWFVVFSSFCQSKFNQIILFIYVFHMFFFDIFIISTCGAYVELVPPMLHLVAWMPSKGQSVYGQTFFCTILVSMLYHICTIISRPVSGQSGHIWYCKQSFASCHLAWCRSKKRFDKDLIKDLGRWWEEDGKKFLDCCHVIIMSLQYI